VGRTGRSDLDGDLEEIRALQLNTKGRCKGTEAATSLSFAHSTKEADLV
jgi:hypothetical protein